MPALTGRVVDLAGILSPPVEATLAHRLDAYQDSTGAQIAVLTVPSLGGAVLEEYATRVFRSWGLGDANRNDGVLVLVSRDDREIRIEVGYGLEAAIPDARAGRIVRDAMVPAFRRGDYDGGVLAAADALMSAPVEPASLDPARSYEELLETSFAGYAPWTELGWWARLLVVLGLVGLAVWLAVRGFSREAWLGRLTHLVLVAGAFVLAHGQLAPGFSLLDDVYPGWVVFGVVYRALQALVVLAPLAFLVADLLVWRSTRFRHIADRRERIQRARARGERSVRVGGRTYRVPRWTVAAALSGPYRGSGSTGRRSGGGLPSGGFSGGGGSSGGGGASGRW